MQKWTKIRNLVAQPKWNYYLLMLLVFAMPFYMRFLPYLIAASLLSWMLQKDIIQRVKKSFSSKYFTAFILFYGLHLIGLIYTKNINTGLFKLQVKLSLIIFPLIIFSSGDYLVKRRDNILQSFVYGNLVASIMCLVLAFYHSFHNGGDELFNTAVWPSAKDWSFVRQVLAGYSYFSYTWLSTFIHVSYFSTYILLGLFYIYSKLINHWAELVSLRRVLYIFIAVFFLLMILLLQSRAAIIALSGLILYEVLYQVLRPGRTGLKIVIAVIFIVLISGVIYNSGRFATLKNGAQEMSFNQLKKDNLRLLMWEKSMDIIKDNFLFGVGTGDVKDAILNAYDQKTKEATKGEFYNSHNEFLETTVRLGIIGGGVLLTILLMPFFNKSNYRDNRLLIAFLIIIILNFLFESMLDRLNGVSFFSFFYCLLILPRERPS